VGEASGLDNDTPAGFHLPSDDIEARAREFMKGKIKKLGMKKKTSIRLSEDILRAIDKRSGDAKNRSDFIEMALRACIAQRIRERLMAPTETHAEVAFA
jgi:hypothetical protein